jgi:hypothetical protein
MHLEYIIDTTGLIYLAVDITKSVAEIMLTSYTLIGIKKMQLRTKRVKRRWDDALSKLLDKKKIPINRDGLLIYSYILAILLLFCFTFLILRFRAFFSKLE